MLNRRDVFIGAGAASLLAVSGLPAHAATQRRGFKAMLGGSHVGGQVVQLTPRNGGVLLQLKTDLSANLLVLKYKYTHESTEFWKDGKLQSISSQTNNNGERRSVTAQRTAAGLEVDGPKFSGVVDGNPSTFSFVVPQLLTRKTWVSTETGKPYSVSSSKVGMENFRTGVGVVNCTKYACRGGLKNPVDVFFAGGELAGHVVRSRGFTIRTAATDLSTNFAALW